MAGTTLPSICALSVSTCPRDHSQRCTPMPPPITSTTAKTIGATGRRRRAGAASASAGVPDNSGFSTDALMGFGPLLDFVGVSAHAARDAGRARQRDTGAGDGEAGVDVGVARAQQRGLGFDDFDVAGDPAREPLAGLGDLLLGEPQLFGGDAELLEARRQVEQRAARLGGDLVAQVAFSRTSDSRSSSPCSLSRPSRRRPSTIGRVSAAA